MGRKSRHKAERRRLLDTADATTIARRVDAALAAGDVERAAALAEAALHRHRDDPSLLGALGRTEWARGRYAAARAALVEAVELAPDDVALRLDLVELLIEDLGEPDTALEVLRAGKRALRAAGLGTDYHAWRAEAWLTMGRLAKAEREYGKACRLRPEEGALYTGLAKVRIEALRLDAAVEALREALARDERDATAHWLLAVLLDRDGRRDEAERHFRAAAAIDRADHFVPQRLTSEEFDRHVERAVDEIPARFRDVLANVELAVEDYPAEGLLHEFELGPLLLGLFVGTPLSEWSFDTTDLPPRVLLFQRNLENECRTRKELVREIGITVRHELGHALGMEEDEIEEAGHG